MENLISNKEINDIIPEGWKIVHLKDIISSLDSGVSVNGEDFPVDCEGYGVLRTSAVSNGHFYPQENKRIKIEELIRAKINPQKGDIIISRANSPELVGEVGYVDKDYGNLYLSDKLWRAIYKPNIDGKWLVSVLSSTKIKSQVKNLATGTSSSMKNISKDNFLSIKIPLPELDEQKRIANVIIAWDRAIELKERLIEQKQEQKKGMIQKLLTGEVRLPGFRDKWEEVKFGDVLNFIRKNPLKNPVDYNLLTVKLHLKGIEGTNKKPNVTTKGRPYYLREPYELLIGRQNFHNGGFGIVPKNMKNYVASNAISSVEAIKGNLKFYYYSLSNDNFYRRIGHIIGGTGQKEVSETMMKKLKLFIPLNEKEQTAIANVLEIIDREIILLREELEQLKQQKKGLMQLFLTGKVRVKV